MATVTSLTAERMIEIEDASVVDAHLDGSGHLILTKFDTTEIDTGALVVPDSSETVKGIVELATTAEAAAAVDTVRAVTPAGLAAMLAAAGINSLSDVTTPTPGSGDFLRWNGSAWVNENDLNLTESQQLLIGAPTSSASIALKRTNTTDPILSSRVGSESEHRVVLDASGLILLGSGSVAGDTNLYRSAANVLRTDDSFVVDGPSLTVSNDVIVGDAVTIAGAATVTGPFKPNASGVLRTNAMSSIITVANSSSETVVASYNIAGGSVAVRATFKIRLFMLAGVTGTPTLTVRSKIGAVQLSSQAIVASSGVTGRPVYVDLYYTIQVSGGAGNGRAFLSIDELLSSATALPTTPVRKLDASVAAAHDTGASTNLEITVQWSAASPSNTITAYSAEYKQVS